MTIEKTIKLLMLIAKDQPGAANQQLAAAVIYKNQIISIGFNSYKSHPFAAKFSKSPDAIYLHAETDAIYKATKRLSKEELKKSTIVIVRHKQKITNHKKQYLSDIYGSAKPCIGCQKCINEYGFKKVIYTNDSDHLSFTTVIAK